MERSSPRQVSAAIIIAGIFYGDVWVGITLPIAFLLSPVLIAMIDKGIRPVPPVGGFVLGALSLVVVVQTIIGYPVYSRSDIIVYLPIIYGGIFVLVFSRVDLSTLSFVKATLTGAAISGTLMVATMWFAPPGFTWVRSQHLPSLEEMIPIADSGASGPTIRSSKIAPPVDPLTYEFYASKVGARNALGFSNYISVFMVVGFVVALFSPYRLLALVFAVFAVATYSRFGILFLTAGFGIWFASRWVRLDILAVGLLVGVAACIGFLVLAAPLIEDYPRLVSITARIGYWESAFPLFSIDHIFGSPRSYLSEKVGVSVYWNPHNSILWLWALFGIGSLLYLAYVLIAMRAIYRNAARDPLWQGIFSALTILVAWSLVEPIVLSPAFEMLLAASYGLAHRKLIFEQSTS